MSINNLEDTTDGTNEGTASSAGDVSSGSGAISFNTKKRFSLNPFTLFNRRFSDSPEFNFLLAKIKKFLEGIFTNDLLKNEIPRIALLFLTQTNLKNIESILNSGKNSESALLHLIYKFLKESDVINSPRVKNSLLNCVLSAFDRLEKVEVQTRASEFVFQPGTLAASNLDEQLVLEKLWDEWREKWLNEGPAWFDVNDTLVTEKQKQLQIFKTIVDIIKPQLNKEDKEALEATYQSAKGWLQMNIVPRLFK